MTEQPAEDILLSICIATLNRGDVIGETLDSILPQCGDAVEVVILDGASTDNTEEVMGRYQQQYASLRYVREPKNSGVDADFDKAVGYARGTYCWLMTDDDLLEPDAIDRVMGELEGATLDLLVVDAEVRDADFRRVLQPSRMFLDDDRSFSAPDDEFLRIAGDQLSFIGAVIIRRTAWLARDRESFYGSLFIHMGVILQSPRLGATRVLARPVLRIRYGNAMWTPRSFEIWMFLWPGLIWRFDSYSESARRAVCAREPWKNPMELLKHRAKGSYTLAEYKRFLAHRTTAAYGLLARLIAVTPASLVNLAAVAYVVLIHRKGRLGLVDLLDSPHATRVSRSLARIFPLRELAT